MPRIAPRVGIGWMVVIAMIIIGGLGVAWHGSRRGADLMALGSSAYTEGDWNRAADLARRRLKAVPGDLEALRLLARSMARLGRDGQANAMFARMGSEALEAEDLLLLGKGLDRAGRKEEAGRVWEKALRLRPDHAESLEQLRAGKYSVESECIGRHIRGVGCDWAAYGLFAGPVFVQRDSGSKTPVFDFDGKPFTGASAEPPRST